MSTHKDLPGGSQAWAGDVDKLMAEVKRLTEVVKRLSENAGIDMSNPKRGINVGDTPSIRNPVGQKLSSLADTDTYNVADGQLLGWSQAGQKWLPVTPLSADGSIDVSVISYSHQDRGYGVISSPTDYAYTAATAGEGWWRGEVELWASNKIYIGQSASDFESMALIQLQGGGTDPQVSILADNCELLVLSDDVSVDGGTFTIDRCSTASRPDMGIRAGGPSVFDEDLDIPIWWNGTTWINALGTVV